MNLLSSAGTAALNNFLNGTNQKGVSNLGILNSISTSNSYTGNNHGFSLSIFNNQSGITENNVPGGNYQGISTNNVFNPHGGAHTISQFFNYLSNPTGEEKTQNSSAFENRLEATGSFNTFNASDIKAALSANSVGEMMSALKTSTNPYSQETMAAISEGMSKKTVSGLMSFMA